MEKEETCTCMICLQEKAKNIELPCKCKITAHDKCWESYIANKNIYECLICHAKFEKPAEQVHEEVPKHKACIMCCCCCLLGQFLLQFI